jgi:hypothetical protein
MKNELLCLFEFIIGIISAVLVISFLTLLVKLMVTVALFVWGLW